MTLASECLTVLPVLLPFSQSCEFVNLGLSAPCHSSF